MAEPDDAQKIDGAAPAADPAPAGAAPAADAVAPPADAVAPPEASDPKGVWPDDWRDRFAGKDEKEQKRLARFQSPDNVYRSFRQLEARLSSGELRTSAPDDPEKLAAWRAENGVPEKPDGYLTALPEGLVIGDDDKPLVATFAAKMHEMNVQPPVVHQALAWWNAEREAMVAEEARLDREHRAAAEDALRAEWGGEYRLHQNTIKGYLDTLPKTDDGHSLGELLLGARLADGTKLGANPVAMKWLAAIAADMNPAGVVVPGSGGDAVDTIEKEAAAIKATMGDPSSPYHRDGGKTQKRYLDLLSALERVKARAA